MNAPLLIALPHGLNASGVTMWAVRLVNALARGGRACALVVHDEPQGQRPLDVAIHPGVEVLDARGLPPLDQCGGDLSPYLPVYRVAVGILATRACGTPVVCSPNLLGDSYGLFAELSRQLPGLLRAIAVHHSDTPYNDLVCEHYAPIVSAFVGVSDRITERLRAALPLRAPDIFGIAYGVEVPGACAPREPLFGGSALRRPLRLLYSGRMDHEQKRVRALPVLSDALARRGIAHELALLGDGPAAAEIDALAPRTPCLRRFPAAPPAAVVSALDTADFFILPSRYEGLSVALLEALAHGCIPILTPSQSGTAQLVRDGETGFLADAGPEATEEHAGLALADALARALRDGDDQLELVRRRARHLVHTRFADTLCARRYAAVIDRAAQSPPRAWPAHRPPAFTNSGGGGSATVPADAPDRLAETLAGLHGRRIAIYGAGRHTLELEHAIRRSGAHIVAILEDDAARHGSTLWGLPIIPPEHAASHGATDIVISSWLHQDRIAARCATLNGLRAHRLYLPGVPRDEAP